MIMLGLYRTGKIPFKAVYLHGLVRDKDRQKMSKSKGNVIDPLGVAELYGTDAVRMALVAGNTAGNDIIISEDKIRGYRNFATKIWNASRFVLQYKPSPTDADTSRGPAPKLTAVDKRNLKELEKVKLSVTKHLENFEFHLAAEKLYHYFWHTFADKIIEAAKLRLQGANEKEKQAAYKTLETILLECLKMLHPFMPFITEEIYQKFLPASAKATAGKAGKILMVENWQK
jgi:valyl-tRNA synthetase